jgi:hypothetical protein
MALTETMVVTGAVLPGGEGSTATAGPAGVRRGAGVAAPALRLLPQIGIIAAAVFAYFGVRGATNSDPAEAVRNADRVIGFERLLHLGFEPQLQRDLASGDTVRTGLNWVYIWGHWPVVIGTLVWLALAHPEVYRRTRNAMMVSGAIGLVVFVTFPVAPPRLSNLPVADTVTLTSHAYRVLQPPMFTNQYAAVPSLHVGWNLLIGLAIVTAARHWAVRLVGALMPAAMVTAVILTGNHYVVDVLLGAGLTTACWFAVAHLRTPGRHSRPLLPALRQRWSGTGTSASRSAATGAVAKPIRASLAPYGSHNVPAWVRPPQE